MSLSSTVQTSDMSNNRKTRKNCKHPKTAVLGRTSDIKDAALDKLITAAAVASTPCELGNRR